MSRAPEIGAAEQSLYDREVPRELDLCSRFPIPPGNDGVLALHHWLDGLKSDGRIAAWYDAGTISNESGTEAVIEFETASDKAKALALWPPK